MRAGAKFTPGPWKAGRQRVVDAHGDGVAAPTWAGRDDDEIDANARLIAAAPELLGAVAAAFAMYGNPRWAHELLELEHLSDDDRAEAEAAITVAEGLRAAIARAEGGAQ